MTVTTWPVLDLGIVVWPLLLGLGLFLLVSAQPLGRPRPALGERLRRLDVQERVRLNAVLAEQATEPAAAVRQPIARLLWPLAYGLGRRLLGLLGRVGLAGGRELDEALRAVWPELDAPHFWGLKLQMALVALVPLVLGDVLGVRAGPGQVWAALLALAGFVAPDLELRRRLAAHRTQVVGELSALLVLIGLYLRGGLSVEQALVEAGRCSTGPVGRGLARIGDEMRLGRTLQEALDGLARHLAVPQVSWLVQQVRSSSQYGRPIEETLRAQAESLSDAQRLALIRQGGRASLLMLPPVALILVATFVVLLLPALLQLDTLGGP
jgi:pilus assembly protein TadC